MPDDDYELEEREPDHDDGPYGYPGLMFYGRAPRWFTALIFLFFIAVLVVCIWL